MFKMLNFEDQNFGSRLGEHNHHHDFNDDEEEKSEDEPTI
jgi:hypothetical protein